MSNQICCLRGDTYTHVGHNPWPLSEREDDRCCDAYNGAAAPSASDEAIRLSGRPEAVLMDGSRRLTALLGLSAEWLLSGCYVNNKSKEPCWPEGHAARDDWFRVRAVRSLLLEATSPQAAPARPTAVQVTEDQPAH